MDGIDIQMVIIDPLVIGYRPQWFLILRIIKGDLHLATLIH